MYFLIWSPPLRPSTQLEARPPGTIHIPLPVIPIVTAESRPSIWSLQLRYCITFQRHGGGSIVHVVPFFSAKAATALSKIRIRWIHMVSSKCPSTRYGGKKVKMVSSASQCQKRRGIWATDGFRSRRSRLVMFTST